MEENKEAKNPEEKKKQEKAEPKANETNKTEKKQDVKPEAKKETKAEKKVEPEKKAEPTEPKATSKEGKKTNVKQIVIICAVIIAIIAIIIVICVTHKKTIDLSKYLDVEFDGYNGYATATVTIDDTLKDYLDSKSTYEKFVEKAKIEVKDNKKLSNGDELIVNVTISSNWLNEKKLKLKDTTIKIPVSGLEDANVLDVFEDLEVEVSGISPNLSVSVNNNNSDSFIRTVTYSLSEYSGLENGDTITITANYDKSKADEEGIVIPEDTMDYTIEGEAEYVASVDDLDEATLTAIRAGMVDKVKDQIDYDDDYLVSANYDNISYSEDFTTSEPELVKTYLLTIKGSSSYWYSNNMVYGIYKVVFTSTTTGNNYDWYYVVRTTNVAVKDGTISNEDDLQYSCSDRWDDGKTEDEAYKDQIDSNKSNYVIETVEK